MSRKEESFINANVRAEYCTDGTERLECFIAVICSFNF